MCNIQFYYNINYTLEYSSAGGTLPCMQQLTMRGVDPTGRVWNWFTYLLHVVHNEHADIAQTLDTARMEVHCEQRKLQLSFK